MYRTVILPVVLYGCETWSLELREEHKLRVSEGRELRRIIGPKRDELTGEWRRWRTEELNDLYFKILLGRKSQEERDGRVMLHLRLRREVHRDFFLRNLRERDHLEDLGVDERIILKWIVMK
jgi:hypothetical protein